MKESKVLKCLCYIIIPIVFAILIISLFYMINAYTYEDQIDTVYFESETFGKNFMGDLKNAITSLIHSQNTVYELVDENKSLRINYGNAIFYRTNTT